MVLKSLILKNFRAYKDIQINFDENMNVIIGQNDIGKSTILEALDIFFGQEIIKMDITDWNKYKQEKYIIIGVEFIVNKELKVLVDATNPTNLKNEYLLNKDGNLEIFKLFNISDNKLSKEKVYLNSFYPQCFEPPLINLKISNLRNELSKIQEEISNYDSINKTKSADIRQALYQYYVNDTTTFTNITIELEKDDAKKVWTSLQNELPLYFLFQSDRANKDSDGDIQNPLKSATKKIVSEFENEFIEIRNNLEEKLNQIGDDTIKKMKDMGLDIANSLTPKVNHKKLDTLFSFSLESDDGIPLNKRGSGFRRMVMLNYFRAEADRKLEEDKKNKNREKIKNVIYAIEEPETSQHPNHQKMLINALLDLSHQKNHQIIITTHTPEIAKMVNEENLILINRDNDKNPIIINDDENKLDLIIKTLGILPSLDIKNIQKIKVIVCFEGYTDIEFIRNINQNIQKFKDIIDISHESIMLLPLGGSALQHYVNNNYLHKLQVPQLHIYDSDYNQADEKQHYKYKKYIDKIISRNNRDWGFMTEKAEIENYIHPELIKNQYNIDTCFHNNDKDWLEKWSKKDLPSFIDSKADKKDPKIEPISSKRMSKKYLSTELSKKLTKEHLEELEAFDEIKGWFEKIKELAECK